MVILILWRIDFFNSPFSSVFAFDRNSLITVVLFQDVALHVIVLRRLQKIYRVAGCSSGAVDGQYAQGGGHSLDSSGLFVGQEEIVYYSVVSWAMAG